MLIPPKYILTPKISQLLSSIEASKAVIDSITIPPAVETNIRRQSSLKSSLFSARIEGNTLTLEEVQNRSSQDQRKVEVFNILKALNLIEQKRGKDITAKDILLYHQIVLEGLVEKANLGKFRKELNAIFNAAGIAIYLPPSAKLVSSLLEKLIKFTNSEKEIFVPIKAALAHYTFEKIHPFLDGNGRVGRLLLQSVLQKGGYGMKGLLSLEEYLDSHRTLYYRSLEESERDVTGFVEFILEAIEQTALEAKELVLAKQHVEAADYLLPRRAEILNVIRDQRIVNFDQIRRRFLRVNERTLRYDLKQLQNAGLIRKRGTTNGVFYEIITKD